MAALPFHNKREWKIAEVVNHSIHETCTIVDEQKRIIATALNLVVARQIVAEHNAMRSVPVELLEDKCLVSGLEFAPQPVDGGGVVHVSLNRSAAAWLCTATIKEYVLDCTLPFNQIAYSTRSKDAVESVTKACRVVATRWRNALASKMPEIQ